MSPRRTSRPYFRDDFEFLPAKLTPQFVDFGWQAETGYRLGPGGRVTAFIEIDTEIDSRGDSFAVWRGYTNAPHRKLRRSFAKPEKAVREVEQGMWFGPLADCWEGRVGPPQRDTWTHQVNQWRDIWAHATEDSAFLFVMQLPYSSEGDMIYAGAINSEWLTDEDGKPRRYRDPLSAMESVERNAVRRGHILGAAHKQPTTLIRA